MNGTFLLCEHDVFNVHAFIKTTKRMNIEIWLFKCKSGGASLDVGMAFVSIDKDEEVWVFVLHTMMCMKFYSDTISKFYCKLMLV